MRDGRFSALVVKGEVSQGLGHQQSPEWISDETTLDWSAPA